MNEICLTVSNLNEFKEAETWLMGLQIPKSIEPICALIYVSESDTMYHYSLGKVEGLKNGIFIQEYEISEYVANMINFD